MQARVDQEVAFAIRAVHQVLCDTPASAGDLQCATQVLLDVLLDVSTHAVDARYQRRVLHRHLFKAWRKQTEIRNRKIPQDLQVAMQEPGMAFDFWPCSWADEQQRTMDTRDYLHLVYSVGLELELIHEVQLLDPPTVCTIPILLSTQQLNSFCS
jgi:hypothetical protein